MFVAVNAEVCVECAVKPLANAVCLRLEAAGLDVFYAKFFGDVLHDYSYKLTS